MSAQTDLRIAIVGAGPSGLSLAWYLSQLGFKKVELFESSQDVGGQSHTKDVDGIPIEMGTCYLADGYIIAREIADLVGTPAERLPPPSFLKPDGTVYEPAKPPFFSVLKYGLKWFGWYLSGQLTNPTDPDNALSYSDWLKKQGLADLATSDVWGDACTAQLYGPVDDISAHNGLTWVRPSLLLTGIREDTAHIPQGFQNMWRALAIRLGYPVHFGKIVEEVKPVRGDRANTVDLLIKGEAARTFDHVVVACPLDQSPDNVLAPPRQPISDMLKNNFAPFKATDVYSAIWRAKNWPKAAPSRCYLPACNTGELGRLLTIRQYGQVGDDWVGQLCSYAVPGTGPGQGADSLKINREAMTKDMEKIVGLKDITFLHERLWRYSIRYSGEQLRQGLPAEISSRQGTENVWYTGGALSHWDVDMIGNFSQDLAARFATQAGLSFFERLRIVRLRDIFKDI